jgi:peroxiredoxin Q/BCP
VKYFMVSVDTLEDNTEFARMHEADFPILADPGKTVAQAYGVLGRLGLASRWTFYIGPDGRILEIDKAVRPATSGEDMVAKLTALGVQENGR